jgi:hypothetical protein
MRYQQGTNSRRSRLIAPGSHDHGQGPDATQMGPGPVGGDGGIRTHTGDGLSALPLPIGLRPRSTACLGPILCQMDTHM